MIPDHIVAWKHFLHYWPFERGMVVSPHKGPAMRSFDAFFIISLNKLSISDNSMPMLHHQLNVIFKLSYSVDDTHRPQGTSLRHTLLGNQWYLWCGIRSIAATTDIMPSDWDGLTLYTLKIFWENLKNMIVFSTISWEWDSKGSSSIFFLQQDKDLLIRHSQNHGCWWPGDARSQGISNRGIDPVLLKYSSLNTKGLTHWFSAFHNVSEIFIFFVFVT